MADTTYQCGVCKKEYPKDEQKDRCMESHGLVKVERERGFDWLRKQ